MLTLSNKPSINRAINQSSNQSIGLFDLSIDSRLFSYNHNDLDDGHVKFYHCFISDNNSVMCVYSLFVCFFTIREAHVGPYMTLGGLWSVLVRWMMWPSMSRWMRVCPQHYFRAFIYRGRGAAILAPAHFTNLAGTTTVSYWIWPRNCRRKGRSSGGQIECQQNSSSLLAGVWSKD